MIIFRETKKRWLVLVEAIILLSGPSALALTGALPLSSRYWQYGIISALIVGRIVQERWSLLHLGIHSRKWRRAFWDHALVTTICLLGLYLFAYTSNANWTLRPITFKIVAFSIFVSFGQELIFRTFLIRRLEKVKLSRGTVVLISATTFALLHSFFPKYLYQYIGLSFVYGVVASYLYIKHRNLIFLTASHFILNLFSVHWFLV